MRRYISIIFLVLSIAIIFVGCSSFQKNDEQVKINPTEQPSSTLSPELEEFYKEVEEFNRKEKEFANSTERVMYGHSDKFNADAYLGTMVSPVKFGEVGATRSSAFEDDVYFKIIKILTPEEVEESIKLYNESVSIKLDSGDGNWKGFAMELDQRGQESKSWDFTAKTIKGTEDLMLKVQLGLLRMSAPSVEAIRGTSIGRSAHPLTIINEEFATEKVPNLKIIYLYEEKEGDKPIDCFKVYGFSHGKHDGLESLLSCYFTLD